MYIVKNSYAEKVIIAICLSGEFPFKSLWMLSSNKQMIQRNVRKLKKEGYISVSGEKKEKTLRLRMKGKEFVKDRFPELYAHYEFYTDNGIIRTGKGNEANLWRSHRLSETLHFMQKAGVYFLASHKPKIDNKDLDNTISLPPNLGFFYGSKEMKKVDEIAKFKVLFTRTLGMLSTSQEHFAVYNTNEGLMLWNNQGENKAQKMMEDIINKSFYSEKRQYVKSAILFGKTMDVALKVLNSKRGKKDSRGFEFLSFDNTYPNMYFFTADDYGLLQIKMIIQENWKNKLNKLLFNSSEAINSDISFDADALDKKNNIAKIEFLSGNIGKIKRAVMASNFNREYTFEVYALNHQIDFLKQFLPKSFKIIEVNLGEFYNYLFN